MAVSIIDGRVEAAEIRRKNKNFRQYSTLRFALDGGGERTIKNAVVSNAVAAHLEPGSAGRFYLFNSIDLRGVHGYRDTAGNGVSGYPGQNEKMGLFAIALGIVAAVLFETFDEGTPVIVLIGILLGVLGFVFTRKSRKEAEQAFAQDNPTHASMVTKATQ